MPENRTDRKGGQSSGQQRQGDSGKSGESDRQQKKSEKGNQRSNAEETRQAGAPRREND